MSYFCYSHNWASSHYSCPLCAQLNTTTSTSGDSIPIRNEYPIPIDAHKTKPLTAAECVLTEMVMDLRAKLRIATEALELSHKCHENLYLAHWGHANLKPTSDLAYLEVEQALQKIREGEK